MYAVNVHVAPCWYNDTGDSMGKKAAHSLKRFTLDQQINLSTSLVERNCITDSFGCASTTVTQSQKAFEINLLIRGPSVIHHREANNSFIFRIFSVHMPRIDKLKQAFRGSYASFIRRV